MKNKKILILLIFIFNTFLIDSKIRNNNLINEFNYEIVNFFSGNKFDSILTNSDFYIGNNYGKIFRNSNISNKIKYTHNFDTSYLLKMNISIDLLIGKTQKYKSFIIVFNSYFKNHIMLECFRNRFFCIDTGKYLISTYLEDENNIINPVGISSTKEILISESDIKSIFNTMNVILNYPDSLLTKYFNNISDKTNLSKKIDFLKNDYKLWKLIYGNEPVLNNLKGNIEFFYISFKDSSNQELAFSFLLEKNNKNWYLDKIHLYKYLQNEEN